MSSSVSSLFLATPSVSNQTAAAESAATRRPAATTTSDVVQLTLAQQVYQLYNQGQRVSQIASSLNLTEAEVNSYLALRATG